MADSIGTLAIKLIALTDTLKPGLTEAERDVAQWTKNIQAKAANTIPTKGIRDGMRNLQADYRQLARDVSKPLFDFDKPSSPRVDLDRMGRSRKDLRFREIPNVSPVDRGSRTTLTGRDYASPTGQTGLLGNVVSGVAAAATYGASLVVEDLAGKLGGVVIESVSLAANFEKTSIAFETLLGNADKAKGLLKDVSSFAQETPFSFTETAGYVKNLLAYGIQVDQTIPTIRALGDVASGTGVDLQRLVVAYGQVATAGQLYGTELRQFTEAGVPIIDALADVLGKPRNRIKDLIEQGKVGFPEVTRAFKRMTEEGGKFAGLTEKFGKSFAGQVEKLKDSIEIVKREFGGALIEELGLKEATQDLTAFSDKIKGLVNDVRPALRFVGELGKAGAQVGYELGKAAVMFGEVQGKTYFNAFPELGKTFEDIRTVVKDLQNWKIDPTTIENAALRLTKTAALSIAGMIDYADEMWDRGEDVAKQFLSAANELKKTAESINSAISLSKDLRDFRTNITESPIQTTSDLFGRSRNELRAPSPDYLRAAQSNEEKRLNQGRDYAAEADWRSRHLANIAGQSRILRDEATKAGAVPYRANALDKQLVDTIVGWIAEDLRKGGKDFMKGVTIPAGYEQFQKEGPLSALVGPQFTDPRARVKEDFIGGNGVIPTNEKRESARERTRRKFEDEIEPTFFRDQAERMKNAALGEQQRQIQKDRDLVGQHRGVFASFAGGAVAFDALSDSAKKMALGFNDLEEQIGGMTKGLYDLADTLNKEFRDPLEGFFDQIDKIDILQAENEIDLRTYDLARADLVKNLAKASDLTKRMPTAAEYGTQEFAKLATIPFQDGPESAESLLKALVDLEKERKAEATKISDGLFGIEKVLDKYRGTPVRTNE